MVDMRRSSKTTKSLILTAARERFATDGYDRATIRAIAADANIDPAMVMRYFASKERLFAAAADLDLELPDMEQTPSDHIGVTLAAHFLERWERDDALMILLRTGVTNETVGERIQAIFATQLTPVVTKLVGDPAEAATRAGLVASQVLGMALCRYVLAFPPVAAMSHDEVVDWIGPTLQHYLTTNTLTR